jgi:hypothetical protein
VGDQLDGAGPPAAALKAQLSGLEFPLSFVIRALIYMRVCECVDGMKALGWHSCVERYYANGPT